MARKKVTLAWIANDSSRRATYKKRKRGLIKKVSELSTLCGVSACAIIYGPGDRHAEVWPSIGDAQQVVKRFKSLPETEQSKKMMNQEAFIRQRMAKLKDQLKKQQRENRQLEVTKLLHQCLLGRDLREVATVEDLSDLAWLTDSKMKAAQERIDLLKATSTAAVCKQQGKEEGGRATTALDEVVAMEMEALQRQQWFLDVMNPQDHMVCGGEEMASVPFGDGNPWLDGCYPYS